VFLINAASFGAVLYALGALRTRELHPQTRAAPEPGEFLQGLRYVWRRPDLVAVMAMMFVVSTFGFNFQIFIPAMSVVAFRAGAEQYGALASLMAAGSVVGALYAARQRRPRLSILLVSAALFGVGSVGAALAPGPWFFGAALVLTGVAAQVYMTSTNSLVQLSTEPAMRGRVMALLLAIITGCTPLGAPVVGWVADAFGPRWSLAVAAASGFAAALLGIRYLGRHGRRHLRLSARARAPHSR
jgi:predicted MFS family arabinose efflux permease